MCPQCLNAFGDFNDFVEHVQLAHAEDPNEKERLEAEEADEPMMEQPSSAEERNPLEVSVDMSEETTGDEGMDDEANPVSAPEDVEENDLSEAVDVTLSAEA